MLEFMLVVSGEFKIEEVSKDKLKKLLLAMFDNQDFQPTLRRYPEPEDRIAINVAIKTTLDDFDDLVPTTHKMYNRVKGILEDIGFDTNHFKANEVNPINTVTFNTYVCTPTPLMITFTKESIEKHFDFVYEMFLTAKSITPYSSSKSYIDIPVHSGYIRYINIESYESNLHDLINATRKCFLNKPATITIDFENREVHVKQMYRAVEPPGLKFDDQNFIFTFLSVLSDDLIDFLVDHPELESLETAVFSYV